jgi:large subunit ribosomal protein L10
VEGTILAPEGVRALADLPPKEVLLGQVVGAFQAPLLGLVTTLEGLLRTFISLVDQIRASREQDRQAQ